MSQSLLVLLRERVASRYYERPEVLDIVARAILRDIGIGRLSAD
jgi:hypothetical protein